MENYAWSILFAAGISEVAWAYYMKMSDGFKNIKASFYFILFNVLSTVLLALSVKILPISIAYPIWVGMGAVGTVVLGMVIFNEKVSIYKIYFLSMVIVGVVGVKII